MTEPVRCVDCIHMDLKGAGPTYAALGLSKCHLVRLRAGSFLSPMSPRECRHFTQAGAERVAKRLEFLR